ncbi:hypothetical protein SLS60_004143 [Paraconiothyrium brasiliense]|uniref:Uncharacterized protein n=1 Tax=Paraconiothyrium brasiliense TaxID=300254 RepID=A0ABR3RQP7_9PLEO
MDQYGANICGSGSPSSKHPHGTHRPPQRPPTNVYIPTDGLFLTELGNLMSGWEATLTHEQPNIMPSNEGYRASNELLVITESWLKDQKSPEDMAGLREMVMGSYLQQEREPQELVREQEAQFARSQELNEIATPHSKNTAPDTDNSNSESPTSHSIAFQIRHDRSNGTPSILLSRTAPFNNPKLSATAEDAINRLNLPELTALKEDQHKPGHRSKAARSGQRDWAGKSDQNASGGMNEPVATTPDKGKQSSSFGKFIGGKLEKTKCLVTEKYNRRGIGALLETPEEHESGHRGGKLLKFPQIH